MTTDQILNAIQILTNVVTANKGLLGSEKTAEKANEKIRDLIQLLPMNHIDQYGQKARKNSGGSMMVTRLK